MPGQVDGLGEPDVLLAEHVLDQPLEHAHPRRAAHDLRMEHQVEEAALLVLALELLDPDLPHVLLAPDPVARRRIRAEAEVHEVVVDPARGQLDQVTVRRRMAVRQVAVHHVRVVDEPVLLEQAEGVLARIRRRRARAEGVDAEPALEDVERLDEQGLLFLGPLEEEGLLVQIPVVADLMPAHDDVFDQGGIALDDPSRHVEPDLEVVAVHQPQDPRHRRLGAIGAHRHVDGPLGERGIAGDPQRLAVEVEGQHHRAPRAVLPLDRHADVSLAHRSVTRPAHAAMVLERDHVMVDAVPPRRR